jgi:multiple sugar transport system substrate-binding protein
VLPLRIRALPGFLLCAFFALFLCASCGDNEENKHRRVLQLWIMPNSQDPIPDMQMILYNFELENPGVEVNVTLLDWNSAWSRITMAATTGSAPDVVQMPTSWAAAVTRMGALASLDSLLNVSGGDSAFVDPLMHVARPLGSDSVTSIPWFVDVRPLYYRRDVLARIGVNPASIVTWNDFINVLQKIQQAHLVIEGVPVEPIGFAGKQDWNIVHDFAPWIWGAGGDILNEQGTKSRIADSASIAGMLFYLHLVRDGYNSRHNLTKNPAQLSADFDEGHFAFWFDATNKTVYFDSPRFLGGQGKGITARNYSCMLPPSSVSGRKAIYFAGGSNLSVFKFTKHRREAEALVRYLTARADVQLEQTRLSGFMPALRAAYEYPLFKEDEKRSVFEAMVSHAKTYPAVDYWGEIETEILLRRFGNLFDIITSSPQNVWPEQALVNEIRMTDQELNKYIQRELGGAR